jgi:DNA-binding protein H-NS
MNVALTEQLSDMSIEKIWLLHQEIVAILRQRLTQEKAILEKRLSRLEVTQNLSNDGGTKKVRSYPRVLPKYRNPSNPNETWSGRGRQPRWLAAQLRSGKRLDHFLI